MPTLPAHPNLEQLRHQAKDLLRAARRGDPEAISRIEAVSGQITLAAAQLAVARDYRFTSWASLKKVVNASAQQPAELWPDVARVIAAEKGWLLRPRALLGQPRADHCTWLAESDQGRAIVKLIENGQALERAGWAAIVLRALRERGMPTPELLWYGPLDERRSLFVQSRLPGEPARVLEGAVLDSLIELIELQANLDVGPGGWDLSWWVGVVVFDGWEGWWEDVERALPELAQRLHVYLQSARHRSLTAADVVHGHLSLGNVLVRNDTVTGIVDWDHVGVGSRALDYARLLFEWQRLRQSHPADTAADGGERLVAHILGLVGDTGLRILVCYQAIATLAFCLRHGEKDLDARRRVVESLLDAYS